MVKAAHLKLDHFDIVGWDVTVDDKENVVLVEYNIKRPGTVFYQYAHGPFFGEVTEQVLSFLKDPQSRKKYVPAYFRAED